MSQRWRSFELQRWQREGPELLTLQTRVARVTRMTEMHRRRLLMSKRRKKIRLSQSQSEGAESLTTRKAEGRPAQLQVAAQL